MIEQRLERSAPHSDAVPASGRSRTRDGMIIGAVGAVVLWGTGFAAPAPHPDWRTLADCAAYYQVNARIADPDRPATMSAMVDETAQEYVAAAMARHRRATHGSADAARTAVEARVKATAIGVAPKPRTQVEKLIEACPQPDD